MTGWNRIAACVALLFWAAAVPAQVPTVPALAPDSALREMLAKRVDVQKQATGIAVGVVTPAGRRVVTYGSLAKGDKRPLNGATVFEIASVTKIFTSLLLADMVAHGEVALDDPVSKYLPADRVTMPTRNGREITLFDLASHTSGLPLRPTNLRSQSALDKYAGYTVEQLYECLTAFHLERDPGTKFEYSNVGFGLLGHALARRAGMSYEALVRKRITWPFSMRDTSIALRPGMSRRRAVGHTAELAPGIFEHPGALEGAGDLHSTTNDLLTLLEAFMGKRSTRLKGAMDLMLLRLVPTDQASTVIGLGWRRTSYDGHEIIWSNGRADGFRTFIGYSPTTRVGVVALANAGTDLGPDDIAQHLIDSFYPVNLQAPTRHKEFQVATDLLDRYLGRYEFEDKTFITVTRKGEQMIGEMTGQDAFAMYAESEAGFFLKDADAQITFEVAGASPADALTLHQGGQHFRAVHVP